MVPSAIDSGAQASDWSQHGLVQAPQSSAQSAQLMGDSEATMALKRKSVMGGSRLARPSVKSAASMSDSSSLTTRNVLVGVGSQAVFPLRVGGEHLGERVVAADLFEHVPVGGELLVGGAVAAAERSGRHTPVSERV